MPKRTSPNDITRVVDAKDLEEVVQDKREGWRASGAKARRRQRRYTKLLLTRVRADGVDRFSHDDTDDHPRI